jgi:regulatory protein
MAWPSSTPKKPKKAPGPLGEQALFDYATASLGRRMRTVMELKRLLHKRVEPGESGEAKIAAVVARLTEYKFLDDPAFAANYTRLRQENQSFGRRRVQQDLLQKGIASEVAAATLDHAYEDVSEEALARRHLERKRTKQPSNDKEAARAMRQLTRAGFSPGVIFKILRNWQVSEEMLERLHDAE